MGEPKFTPGPWHFHAGQLWSESRDGLGLGIQSRLLLGTWSEGPGLGHAAEPNAHLIAGAPALYEALQQALLQIEYLHEKFQETSTGNAVLARGQVALAKARGEQP